MSSQNKRRSPSAVELLRELAEEGIRIFNSKEFAKLAPKYGISSNYTRVAIHYLHQSGWITYIKKGVYAMGPALLGNAPLHEFEVAMALVKPGAIAYWSALQYHNLTDQIPEIIYVLTTKEANIPRIRRGITNKPSCYDVEETTYQFTQVEKKRFFGTEQVWINEEKVSITDPERTLIDAIQKPQNCGDFGEVLHAFKMIGNKLNLQKIIDYALKMDAATAKRLGWILSKLKIAERELFPLKNLPIQGYRKLDVSKKASGPYNQIWKVQENII